MPNKETRQATNSEALYAMNEREISLARIAAVIEHEWKG